VGNTDGGLLESSTKAVLAFPQPFLDPLAISDIPSGRIDQVSDWNLIPI
jgi:hypothetical protein